MTFEEIKKTFYDKKINPETALYQLNERITELYFELQQKTPPLKLGRLSHEEAKKALKAEAAYLADETIDQLNDEIIACQTLISEIERQQEKGNLKLLLDKLLIAKQESNQAEISRLKNEVKTLIENQIAVLQETLQKILNDE